MLIGQYEHSLDEKGRVVLPIKFRYSLGEKFYITKGVHGCLTIYPEQAFMKLNQELAEQPPLDEDALLLQRVLCGSAFEVTTDNQNRLAIPAVLRKYAGIEGDAVLVGTSNRIEMWNPKRWEALNNDVTPEALMAAAKARRLGEAPSEPAAS